jgi:hypothetical protein
MNHEPRPAEAPKRPHFHPLDQNAKSCLIEDHLSVVSNSPSSGTSGFSFQVGCSHCCFYFFLFKEQEKKLMDLSMAAQKLA